MRQPSSAEKELWGNTREILKYLKEAQAILQKNRKRDNFDET